MDRPNSDTVNNVGLGPLLKRFGVIDLLNSKLESLSFLQQMLVPALLKNKEQAKLLEQIFGIKKLYELNVKPLLDNTNHLWGDRLFDQVCGFFPGMLPPLAPRETTTKFGPHVLLPQLPLLPNTIRFSIGELTLTKEGGIHISEDMFKWLMDNGPSLPGTIHFFTEYYFDWYDDEYCDLTY